MRVRKFLGCLIVVFASCVVGATAGRGGDDGIKCYLLGSLHTLGDFHKKKGETFPDKLEQGLFVYDINEGHKLVKKFPAKSWQSWSGGWAGLAAHADSGVLFQVQDGGAIRAYDILGEKLLWETFQAKVSSEQGKEKVTGTKVGDTGKFGLISSRRWHFWDGRAVVMTPRTQAD